MSYYPAYHRPVQESSPRKSSPLRQGSNASTSSSAYSNFSNPFAPSRTSTISSAASSGYRKVSAGSKRPISETSPTRASAGDVCHRHDGTSNGNYKSARQSLRPLPQPPGPSPPSVEKPNNTHMRGQSLDPFPKTHRNPTSYSPVSTDVPSLRAEPTGISRSNSIRPRSALSQSPNTHRNPHGPLLTAPDLTSLEHSSTGHLRNLSRLAQSEDCEDFSLCAPTPSVVGLQGRRQLKRTDSVRDNKRNGISSSTRSAWDERNWMDKQRKFLQAYEYLCHIGEAKEWIEDVIHNPLPPIVQLEEALRNGVTLAEIVQALQPHRSLRIFRHPRLQFRHSDNIAIFFDFLADVELPDLFRFELIDLYEKKNIPKVIYCIHALSWLLYRKGIVDFRIGNLVGQLEFEHHELEEMQKGLDKAGISMPSFSGMGASFGAEPEPEPVETEEQRERRELEESEASVNDLQAQMRGAMVRMNLGRSMQGLWDSEEWLIELQSIVRGDWARQVVEYRLSMRCFAIALQSAARGYIARSRQRGKEEWLDRIEPEIVSLQSLFRARRSRVETQQIRSYVRRQENGIRDFQAAIRGALRRRHVEDQLQESFKAGNSVLALTAAIRGMLQRRKLQDDRARLRCVQPVTKTLQAATRGFLSRQRRQVDAVNLKNSAFACQSLQAAGRAMILRRQLSDLRCQLSMHEQEVVFLQSFARGASLRNEVEYIKDDLQSSVAEIISFQSFCRGGLFRQRHRSDYRQLQAQRPQIVILQSHIRGMSTRNQLDEQWQDISSCHAEITQLQALSRAMMVRVEIGSVLSQFEEEESTIEMLQAVIRGRLVRGKFQEKQRYFKQNMEKVVKVQSYVRAKQQGEAYKSLTSGNNPPVGTVKGFVHLLNDSDFDFDEEVEFERLRKTVVQHVRQNEMADQYIAQLDIKIALLVKNKITLDEVVKHQKHFGGDVGNFLTNAEISSKDPFDLKALNKNSRKKLEHYQELFFLLQTQPQYLARLFRRIRERGTAEKECERMKHLMMGVFGYAQKRREEYYLIKLIARSMKEEIDRCQSIQDYLRGNFFWARLFGAYVKSPRDRKYMREIMGPIIRENIIDNPELDLESDPMQIYLSSIENEQLRTGQRSRRPPEIPQEEAIRDEETRQTFIIHLQDLRDIADQVFAALEDHLHKMPFGVRYLAQQMFATLSSRFEHDDRGHILRITGQWLWKSYLQPALTEPEKFGVVDRGLSHEHRRNISEVAKVLGQVAAGRKFGVENAFLQPLNGYVVDSIQRLGEVWSNLINVPTAETQFDIDEFNDLYARTKPTLYIKMTDIFSIHHLIAADIPIICTSQEDVLREVVGELGSVQNNEHELKHVSSSEICLTLSPKLRDKEGEFEHHYRITHREANKREKIPMQRPRHCSWKPSAASST
ncbi:MAG: hypothetical protein Q9190_004125 [Brigantiaea leucoxantha]